MNEITAVNIFKELIGRPQGDRQSTGGIIRERRYGRTTGAGMLAKGARAPPND